MAHDYVSVYKNENRIHIFFHNEHDKPYAIGQKMYEIHDGAYMNGYNWDAFLQYYLAEHEPELLDGLDSDPEAGSYAAFYPLTEENEKKAQRFVDILISLMEHEELLYQIVREKGDEIEWD